MSKSEMQVCLVGHPARRGSEMTKIVIDPELEKVCLPLKDDEYSTLEKQLIRDGCLDTLKVWDRDGELVLLDGHNRLKICKERKIPFETSTIEISSIDEAIVWIVDNQDGRRNSTEQEKAYISGKRYEAQKNINKRRDSNGLFIANAPTEQNAKVDYKRPDAPTASKQAQDEGVDPATVLRNAQFARGVDILIEKNPAVAQAILKPKGGRPPLSKIEVRVLPRLKKRLEKEHPKKFDEIISSGVTAIKEAVKKERDSHKNELDAQREAKEQEKFDEFDREANALAYQAKKEMRVIKNSIQDGACLLPNVIELWCKDCNWGFDVYLPIPHGATPTCPYCQGKNIDKRKEDWNPRYEALK